MNDLKRYAVHITGIVQGVGMRPYIYRTANQLNLGGWVCNQGASVVIELAGSKKNIREFLNALLEKPPSGAKISAIKITSECYEGYGSFSIINSSAGNRLQGFIPPDTAICDECIKEIQDKTNRRYMYTFTSCTSCGPRYSIIKALPYDRVNTSMSAFEMCPACRSEYENSDNRRFHAQTNCCPDCGPKLMLLDRKGRLIDSINPVATARQLLQECKLIAIKGIGGYHLACNACDETAVNLLRIRKRRPERPLAIMAASLDAAKIICKISGKEEEILTGRQRPVVLLEKRYPERLSHNIAPGLTCIGVMLPYTPLHQLLFQQELQYLAMTSGNLSGMPICYKDEETTEKLKDIADYFLVHDREILTPIDDSVVRVIDEKEMVSRSARGYSPAAFRINIDNEIMAMGAQQKSSLCLVHKGYAHTTQYLGNLEDMNSYEEYLQVIKRIKVLLDAEPQLIAHDLHTGYISTQYAIKQSAQRIPIQHHHAHMAACMAEHELKQDVIGIIYDGTGMGTDGAIWGGEFFIGSRGYFSRVGHWKYVTLQGGDSAIREPWKSAASYLYAMGIDSEEFLSSTELLSSEENLNSEELINRKEHLSSEENFCSKELHNSVNSVKVRAVYNAIRQNINCFKSSSIGRLFDCVSALVMKRMNVTYDAQAAIELESIIELGVTDFYPYSVVENEEKLEIGYEEIISGILEDMRDGVTASYISAKFHNTVCEATIDCAYKIRSSCGIGDIVFSGGVFENAYLLKNMNCGLKKHGFNTYHNMKIPTNDGGIAFGQAVAAAQTVEAGFCDVTLI